MTMKINVEFKLGSLVGRRVSPEVVGQVVHLIVPMGDAPVKYSVQFSDVEGEKEYQSGELIDWNRRYEFIEGEEEQEKDNDKD